VRRPLTVATASLLVGLGLFGGLACGGGSEAAPVETTAPAPLERLRIIFPEGFTVREMADRVAAVREIAIAKRKVTPRLTRAAYLRAVERAVPPPRFRRDLERDSMEGFLFPAGYEFTQETTAKELVADQLETFRERFGSVDLSYARSKNLTPYDILIIASMIEKETLAPDERKLVSAVIYNRLHERMPLGIDATLRYGFDIPPTKSILQSQLDSTNPYNSRKIPGLPPTPIANPGLASIQAAAHPAKVDYLYFVRKPDRVHHFFTASDSAFAQYECAHGYGC
jgi:UPF0755 protein